MFTTDNKFLSSNRYEFSRGNRYKCLKSDESYWAVLEIDDGNVKDKGRRDDRSVLLTFH